MSTEKRKKLLDVKFKNKISEVESRKFRRESIRYQIINNPSTNECKLYIVELTAGWHKDVENAASAIDINSEIIGGFRYSKQTNKDVEAEVFGRASGEVNVATGNPGSVSLGKGEFEISYNAQQDKWTKKGVFSKPNVKVKSNGISVDQESNIEYGANGKIIGIKLMRKQCN